MKYLLKSLICFFICLFCFSKIPFVIANEEASPKLLQGSVTVVPSSFFGTWRVTSKLMDTDSPTIFKQNNVDVWNLSRTNDVITLSNPFNGAKAEITIDMVNNNRVIFTQKGKFGSKILTDRVEIKLTGDTFKGFDSLQLDTYSDVNGKIIKTETAKYYVEGEKIAGQSIIGN